MKTMLTTIGEPQLLVGLGLGLVVIFKVSSVRPCDWGIKFCVYLHLHYHVDWAALFPQLVKSSV